MDELWNNCYDSDVPGVDRSQFHVGYGSDFDNRNVECGARWLFERLVISN